MATGVTTAIVYTLCCIYASPSAFVYRLHPATQTCRPVNFDLISPEFFFITRPKIGYYITGIIPIGIVVVCTAIVIMKMRNKGRKTNSRGTSRHAQKDLEITRQMIVVGVIFATFSLGFTICNRVYLGITVETFRDQAVQSFVLSVRTMLLALTNSTNFLIYIIFGKRFRAGFVGLWRKNASTGTTTNKSETVRKATQDANTEKE